MDYLINQYNDILLTMNGLLKYIEPDTEIIIAVILDTQIRSYLYFPDETRLVSEELCKRFDSDTFFSRDNDVNCKSLHDMRTFYSTATCCHEKRRESKGRQIASNHGRISQKTVFAMFKSSLLTFILKKWRQSILKNSQPFEEQCQSIFSLINMASGRGISNVPFLIINATERDCWQKEIPMIIESSMFVKKDNLQNGPVNLKFTEDCFGIIACSIHEMTHSADVFKRKKEVIDMFGSILTFFKDLAILIQSHLEDIMNLEYQTSDMEWNDYSGEILRFKCLEKLSFERDLFDTHPTTWIFSNIEDLCVNLSNDTLSYRDAFSICVSSIYSKYQSLKIDDEIVSVSSLVDPLEIIIDHNIGRTDQAHGTCMETLTLVIRNLLNQRPSKSLTSLYERVELPLIPSILERVMSNRYKIIHDMDSELYENQMNIDVIIVIPVALEILKGDIIIENIFGSSVRLNLADYFEFYSIHLNKCKSLRPICDLIFGKGIKMSLKPDNFRVVLKDETTMRKTLILQSTRQIDRRLYERQPGLKCDTSVYKVPLYSTQKVNRYIIGQLLKESLKDSEGIRSLKENKLKHDIVDLQMRHTETLLEVYPVSRNSLDYTFEQIVAGKSLHSTDVMRFEMQRFASFANFDYPDTPSAFEFAKAGWYATGLGKETACFICNVKFSEWTNSLKPFDVHAQLSPECPFIKGEDVEAVNVDRTIHQNVNGHSARRDFESLTNDVEQMNLTDTNGSATSLQPHGFTDNPSSPPQNDHYVNGFSYSPYHDAPFISPPTRDQTDNLLNGHQLNGFRHVNGDSLSNGQVSVDNPSRSSIHSEFVHESSNGFSSRHFNGHSRSHSDRPHLQQNNNPFVPFTADLLPHRPLPMDPPSPEIDHGYLLPPPISVFSTPKFPAYHPLNVRISSYQGFPSHTGQSPRVLAQAGMFYRGYSDRCSCFWCGIGLQNWSMEDDPWVEHARWSPRCQYLIDAKGEEFIALVQESYRQEDPVFPELNDDDTMIAELQSIGFSTESIQSAIKTLKSNGRNVNLHIVANFILENMLTEPQAQANENNLPKSDHPSQIGKKEEPNNVKANTAPSFNNVNSHKTNSLDENSKSMYEETTAMKEQLTCKVCMDKNVSVVFLPCGHIVACGVCSVRLSKCPICRKFIREKVKTLMS